MNWKKVIIIIFIVLIIIVPIVLIFGRLFVALLPQQRKKAIHAAQEYLKENYVQHMVYSYSYLVLEPFEYSVRFYPENEPTLEFKVRVSTDFSVFADDYYINYYNEEMRKELSDVIIDLWGNEAYIICSISPQPFKNYNIPNLNEQTPLEDIKSYLYGYTFQNYIRAEELNLENADKEANLIFQLILKLKEYQYHPNSVSFYYKNYHLSINEYKFEEFNNKDEIYNFIVDEYKKSLR